ncbi:GTPase IMAP family member 2-like [Cyprinus carpio]|uniref:GTPase IMAP family member 2-like n=1 Tax=Cyprinus carpio TaxID=7962 RepID=A0A9R0A0W2_CYPCA|nr:GTPase IMAP family member 2-like [Cyprinus carpio]
MGTKFLTSTQGSSMQSMLRVVLFGNTGADKNNVIKSMLIGENLTGEKNGLCTLYKSERAGRRISVVEAPGWHGHSQQTPENIKEEITRSVLLCPPGPHALLLVIPVKTLSEEPSVGEMNAAEMHMELLSERVWKHTIVRFACDEGVEEPTIRKHVQSAEKILEKCGGRSHVLQTSACGSQTQTSELFQKIDSLVEESRGDVFIPQAYYELIQKKTQEASGATELRQRRGSLQHNPPNVNKHKGDSEEKKSAETARHSDDGSKITMDFTQFVLILMGAFGALLGSVAGAENGVRGSFIGVVFGIFVGVLVALFIMYVYTHFYSKQTTQSAS